MRKIPMLLVAGTAAATLATAPGLAEMVVRLKDGSVQRLPVEAADVESISFTSGGGAASAPRAGAGASAQAAPEPAPAAASGRTLKVGPGGQYQRPSQAAAAAKDGDVIEIAAGTYDGDVATWKANGVTIRGVGGLAHLRANGKHAEGKAIWVIRADNVTVENVEFSGARVPDGNGAGIRFESKNLTLRDCVFHDNENGILVGDFPETAVTIESSTFFNNGAGDGYTHNIYVGAIRLLTVTGSNIHHAKVGHNIKSRARTNRIAYNRLMDEADGTSSYTLDFEAGGTVYLIGNVIQQGPQGENWAIVNFASGRRSDSDRLVMVNNTFVNDYPGGIFINNKSTAPALARNNIFAGTGTVLAGPGALESNLISKTVIGRGSAKAEKGTGANTGNLTATHVGFADPAKYDYTLTAGSPAADAGTDPGKDGEVALTPTLEFKTPHGTVLRPRKGALDIGAYEAR